MPYNLTERLDLLGVRMKDLNADPLGPVKVRKPDGTEVVEVVAAMGNTNAEDVSPGAPILRAELQDFIFDCLDLDFGSGPELPGFGWEVERANGEVFRVVGLGEGNPPYRYITATRLRIRVHTSRIE
jgi:hypothetical protein